jgi:hippurate hydrolase
MDALSLKETTGLPFASQKPGLMHACGHDGHIAMVLGAAAILRQNPPPGKLVFIFQPGEEGGAGAKHMVEAGVIEGIDAIFACHLDPHFTVGEISLQAGPVTAFTERFNIEIRGKGGHGARPHEAVDAIVVASSIVLAIQTIVSRQIDPTLPAVVSIGRIEGGTAFNVIASTANLRGSIRATDSKVREKIKAAISRIVQGTASMHRAKAEINYEGGYPAVINSPKETKLVSQAIQKILGNQGQVKKPYTSLGGEDFAYYLEKVPGCFIRIGSRKKGTPLIPTHSPSFNFDEEALKIGTALFVEIAHLYGKREENRDRSI